jgi:hypothetical protein
LNLASCSSFSISRRVRSSEISCDFLNNQRVSSQKSRETDLYASGIGLVSLSAGGLIVSVRFNCTLLKD